jgi:hypothetical protein
MSFVVKIARNLLLCLVIFNLLISMFKHTADKQIFVKGKYCS